MKGAFSGAERRFNRLQSPPRTSQVQACDSKKTRKPATMRPSRSHAMGIWIELGVFGLVLVFAFWQMHDVRKAQEQTRQQREREKAQQAADKLTKD